MLARIDGVGDVNLFGLREYSMRVWLDPERLASRNLTTERRRARRCASRTSRSRRASIGQPPVPPGTRSSSRSTRSAGCSTPEQFENVIVKTGADGRITRVRDVARIELGARDYAVNSYLDNQPAVAMAVAQRPGSNALATADAVERDDARSCRRASPRASSTASSTTRRSSSASRSTR